MQAEVYDIIIAGAGAAGCVLASRLSERPDIKVLLLEAGPDSPPGHEHPDIRDPFPVSSGNPDFMWPGLLAEVPRDRGHNPLQVARPFSQGRGVGGGSNVQGMFAVRGIPEDYDEWRDLGVSGWGWEDVLPYFTKLERDLDFSGPLHGDAGPLPVRRNSPATWAPFSAQIGRVIESRGFRSFDDYNGDFGEGLSALPMANLPERRVSASMAYLGSLVRQRPNLFILPNTTVERLLSSNNQVTGVVATNTAGQQRYLAHETIVSCGALQTPTLLLRSGIGPAKHLRDLGINVVMDLPGVGSNLQNHPKIQDIAVFLPKGARQPHTQRTLGQNCLRYSSNVAGCPPKDMFLVTFNRTAWHSLGRRIGALGVVVHKPFSKGNVELGSPDPTVAPRIRFNALSDARDFERLARGLRFALELLADPRVILVRGEAFLPDGKMASRLARRSGSARVVAALLATLFENRSARRLMLRGRTLDLEWLVRKDDVLQELVNRHLDLSRHVCGTCKMGPSSDPQAVVDIAGNVRGVPGLRVADASIFPTLMRANTHLPVIMAAEKLSDQIKAGWPNTSNSSTRGNCE